MKILKYLFFLFLIVIIAGAIYIATKDGDYRFEETVVVNAPVPVVFNEVNNFTNWETWGPWRLETEDVVVDYKETTRGEGAGLNWTSDEVGDGSITTTKVIPNSAIEQSVIHKPTFAESHSDMYWKFEEVEERTLVTLGLKGSQSFREKLAFAFTDNTIIQMMKPNFTKGLQELKIAIQDKMSAYSINIDGVTTHGGGFYMYSTTATKINQIPVRMPQLLIEVRQYMESNNISMQGDPFVLYNNWDGQNNSAIYSVGIFTPSLVITPSESTVLNGMMPVKRVIKTTLKGDHKNLVEAWEKAYAYMEDNNIAPDEESQAFEVYKTDPVTTLNPANWITEIFIPIKEEAVSNPE